MAQSGKTVDDNLETDRPMEPTANRAAPAVLEQSEKALGRLLEPGECQSVPSTGGGAGQGPDQPAPFVHHPRLVRPKNPDLNPYVGLLDTLPSYIVAFEKASAIRGSWQKRFRTVQPLYVDLGSGMGHFLTELARRHPDRNFLGIELKYKRLYKSAQKAIKNQLTNVQYVRFDALQLDQIFAPRELHGMYINYPDPWPKSHHHPRRIVSPLLVSQLERILVPGGWVRLKSDWEPNRHLFIEAFEGSTFVLTDSIPDLSAWDRSEQNISTSYEERFTQKGLACFFYEFTLPGQEEK